MWAGCFSEIRDAEVRVQTVQQLQRVAGGRGGSRFRRVEAMLMMDLENFMAAFAEWQVEALPLLETARSAVDQWRVDDLACEQLRRAVQRSYKQARKALAQANEKRTADCFHEFRSKAKLLWYQLRILQPINQVVLKTFNDEMDALGALLGRAHDLSFVGERLRHSDGTEQWQREAAKLIAIVKVGEGI
jgi:CHAD domain-containing protein